MLLSDAETRGQSIDPEEARVAPFRDRYKDVVPGVLADGSPYDYTRLALSPDGRVLIRYAFFRPTLVEMIDAKTLTSM